MSCSQVLLVYVLCNLVSRGDKDALMSCVILCQEGTKRTLCHALVYALSNPCISTPCWNLLEFGLFGI